MFVLFYYRSYLAACGLFLESIEVNHIKYLVMNMLHNILNDGFNQGKT